MANNWIYIVYCDGYRGKRIYIRKDCVVFSNPDFTCCIEDAMHFDAEEAMRVRLWLINQGCKNVNGRVDHNVRNTLVRSLVYGENSL